MTYDWAYVKLKDGRLVDDQTGVDINLNFPTFLTVEEAERYLVEHDVRATVTGKVETVKPRWGPAIMQALRYYNFGKESLDTSMDAQINEMSRNEVFDALLSNEGIIGYGMRIRMWVQEIYGVDLDAVW